MNFDCENNSLRAASTLTGKIMLINFLQFFSSWAGDVHSKSFTNGDFSLPESLDSIRSDIFTRGTNDLIFFRDNLPMLRKMFESDTCPTDGWAGDKSVRLSDPIFFGVNLSENSFELLNTIVDNESFGFFILLLLGSYLVYGFYRIIW